MTMPLPAADSSASKTGLFEAIQREVGWLAHPIRENLQPFSSCRLRLRRPRSLQLAENAARHGLAAAVADARRAREPSRVCQLKEEEEGKGSMHSLQPTTRERDLQCLTTASWGQQQQQPARGKILSLDGREAG